MSKYCKNCYKEKIDASVKDEDLSYYEEAEKCDGCGEVKHLVKVLEKDPNSMTIAECNCETQKHIETVRKYIRLVTDKLTTRGVEHDASKLAEPEASLFAQHTKKLSQINYDSPEYRESLEALSPALNHHYSVSRHHPQHFQNGINDMTLIDIMEMVCDWKASTLRMNAGNLLKSIDINAERFGIDDQLKQILVNTAKLFDDQ